ncbi:MAG: paraquat-inducible protein A [Balneolaceae bacterium]
MKYGIFSVDEWKNTLSEIVIKRINEFSLEDTNEDELRRHISEFLVVAVDKLEKSFFEQNSSSLGGFLKGGVATITNVFGVMKKDIPLLTDSIVNFLNDPKNKVLAKDFFIKRLNEYSDDTFSEIDYTTYDLILANHQQPTKKAAIDVIMAKIEVLDQQQKPYSFLIFFVAIFLMIGTILSKNLESKEFLLLTLNCSVLLIIGILLPMINIDARISEMDFQLMGESITFTDQVLYFKSKSILEVVQLMLLNNKPDVIAVGILVLVFSVIFPLSKLTASVIHLYSKKLRQSRIVKFMVFKTAKWSMADVMVVAIFMAFIGFSGIISEQLKDLENIAIHVDIMTTNESSLQIGFFLFTAFAVLSLLVSHKLQFNFKGKKQG